MGEMFPDFGMGENLPDFAKKREKISQREMADFSQEIFSLFLATTKGRLFPMKKSVKTPHSNAYKTSTPEAHSFPGPYPHAHMHPVAAAPAARSKWSVSCMQQSLLDIHHPEHNEGYFSPIIFSHWPSIPPPPKPPPPTPAMAYAQQLRASLVMSIFT